MRRPESSNDRIEDYFFEMKDDFDNNGKYSVYVIHLDDEIKENREIEKFLNLLSN